MANHVQSCWLEPPFTFIVGILKTPIYLAAGIVSPISAPLDRLMNNDVFTESQSRSVELPHVEVDTFIHFAKDAIHGRYYGQPPIPRTGEKNHEIKPRENPVIATKQGIPRAKLCFHAFQSSSYDLMVDTNANDGTPYLTLPLTLHAKLYLFAHEQCIVGLQVRSYHRLFLDLRELSQDSAGLMRLVLVLAFVYGVPSLRETAELKEQLKQKAEGTNAEGINVEDSLQEYRNITAIHGETCKELGLREMVVSFAATRIHELMAYEPFLNLLDSRYQLSRDILQVLYGSNQPGGLK